MIGRGLSNHTVSEHRGGGQMTRGLQQLSRPFTTCSGVRTTANHHYNTEYWHSHHKHMFPPRLPLWLKSRWAGSRKSDKRGCAGPHLTIQQVNMNRSLCPQPITNVYCAHLTIRAMSQHVWMQSPAQAAMTSSSQFSSQPTPTTDTKINISVGPAHCPSARWRENLNSRPHH